MGFFSKIFNGKKSSKTSAGNKAELKADGGHSLSEEGTLNTSCSQETQHKSKSKQSSKSRSSGGSKSKSSTHRNSSSVTKKEGAPEEAKSPNIRAAEEFMRVWNNYTTVDDMLRVYSSEKARLHFEDGFSLPARESLVGMGRLYASFPDMTITYKSMKESKNKVTIDGVRCQGTHTGAPYSMVPGLFPEVETSGIHCINDEERIILKFTDDHMVASVEVIALGNCTGPAGFYEQIGGNLTPPAPAAPAPATGNQEESASSSASAPVTGNEEASP